MTFPLNIALVFQKNSSFFFSIKVYKSYLMVTILKINKPFCRLDQREDISSFIILITNGDKGTIKVTGGNLV